MRGLWPRRAHRQDVDAASAAVAVMHGLFPGRIGRAAAQLTVSVIEIWSDVDQSFSHYSSFYGETQCPAMDMLQRFIAPPLNEWAAAAWKQLKGEAGEASMSLERLFARRYIEHVRDICGVIFSICIDVATMESLRRFYVNCGAAIAATYSPALRMGESCPGDQWDPVNYWSRQTIVAMMDKAALDRDDVQSVVIQVMKRKTP